MNAVQMFELILNSGIRTTTYKFGLLTSIVDYVIENPIEPQQNNFHFIPTFYLAKQFLAYYYPLVINDVKQGPTIDNKYSTKIRKHIIDFVDSENKDKELPFPLVTENTNKLILFVENNELPLKLVKLLFEIRRIIIDQPMQHIRKTKGEQVSIFGLLTNELAFQEDYEKHREAGKKLKWVEVKEKNQWNELLEIENLELFFGHQTYTEISNLRFWLRDVLIKRWAQESNEKYNNNKTDILPYYDLWKNTPERDSALIRNYRDIYIENGLATCLYCGKTVEKELQLDHLLPWSKFPVNGFWNLYPSCAKCNSLKSDRIPKISADLVKRIKNHLAFCLDYDGKQKSLFTNDLEKLYATKFKNKISSKKDKNIEEIIEYISNISNNLLESLPGQEF